MDYGGVMAIIVDNKQYEKATNLIMADDGTGHAVKIPSFLIGYHDGAILKESIHETEEINEDEKNEEGKSKRFEKGGKWWKSRNNRVIV